MSPRSQKIRSSGMPFFRALKIHSGFVSSVSNPARASASRAGFASSRLTNRSMSLVQRGRPSTADASATINGMLTGASDESRVDGQVGVTLPGAKERRLSHHFIVSGLGTLVANSQGQPWQGDYVFNSGDLVLDLLHNFFLESGARAQKIRVYEMTDHPIARQMLGYLLVRGGVHQLAYAKALEELTGVEIPKLLNIPNIPNSKFPETRQWQERGLHRVLYRFSPDDYRDIGQIWQGGHPDDGKDVEVVDGPPEGAPRPDTPAEAGIGVPTYERGFFEEVAQRLLKRS